MLEYRRSLLDAALFGLLGCRYPIMQAPMAGGPTTPALAAAVAGAGGFGSLPSSIA